MHRFDAKTDNMCKFVLQGKKFSVTPFLKKSSRRSPDFETSIKTAIRDYRKRLITVDNSGIVRIHDPSKSIQFKKECSGNSKKILKLSNNKDKLYFIWAQDRSVVIEIDLRSIDFKSREIRFTHGKIIDLEILGDRQLAVLNKEGWVEMRDLKKKEYMPPTFKFGKKPHGKLDNSDDEDQSKKKQEKADDGTPILEDVIFQLDHGRKY